MYNLSIFKLHRFKFFLNYVYCIICFLPVLTIMCFFCDSFFYHDITFQTSFSLVDPAFKTCITIQVCQNVTLYFQRFLLFKGWRLNPLWLVKRSTGTPDCSCCLHLLQQLLQLQPLLPQHIHVSNLETFFLNARSSYRNKEILIFSLKFDCAINYIV